MPSLPLLDRIVTLAKRLYRLSESEQASLRRHRRRGLRVGRGCRILSQNFGSEPYLIRIGDHVTITSGVRFVTHDGSTWVFRDEDPDLEMVRPIVIGNNVFIGVNTVVLLGSVIEDDVVVGALSLVKGRLKSGWVYAGIPARPIKPLAEYRQAITPHVDHLQRRSAAEKERFYKEKFRAVMNGTAEP